MRREGGYGKMGMPGGSLWTCPCIPDRDQPDAKARIDQLHRLENVGLPPPWPGHYTSGLYHFV